MGGFGSKFLSYETVSFVRDKIVETSQQASIKIMKLEAFNLVQ